MEAALADAGFLKTASTLEFGPSDAELQRTRAQGVGASGSQDQGFPPLRRLGLPRAVARGNVWHRQSGRILREVQLKLDVVTVGGVEIDSASAENRMINALITQLGDNMMKVNADTIH